MSVSRIGIAVVLAVAIIGGVGLMWPRTYVPECKVMTGGGMTLWDGSDPACRDQGSRR